MTCSSCGDKPKNKSREFPSAVIEIDNPETIVLLRKVVIPASLGDDETIPPAIGKYRNVILHYEANKHTYLYSSDGIPTLLVTDVPQEVLNRIANLETGLQIETKDREDADTALDNRLTTVEGIAATALQPSAINKVVMTDIALDANTSTTTVQINGAKENLLTGAQTTKNLPLPVASHDEAGIMNSSTFDAVVNNTSNINALMNGAVAITGLSASPTQSELTTAWQTETGLTTLMNRAGIYDVTNNKVWTYYTNDTTWHPATNTTQVTINTFTNSAEGTIKGSTNVGQIFAENDGTGSVNGWDALSNNVSTNSNNITSLQTNKQDKLTAGANINIDANNVISATGGGAGYIAGNAIEIENNVISADVYPADFFTAGETVSGEGSSITMDKTIKAPLKDVRLLGDTTQQTYTGKNLYNATSASATHGTLTWSADTEYLYMNGVINSDQRWDLPTTSLKAGTYRLMLELVSGQITSTGTGMLIYVDGTNVSASPEYKYLSTNIPKVSQTITVSADTTNFRLWPFIRTGDTYTNAVIKYQLVAGSTEDYNFEPYVGGVPSPNPDYPQNINVVTGEQDVYVHGKNLFNFDNGTLNFTQHITHTNDSNSVTMTATDATGTQYAIIRFSNLDPTKTYKISGKAKKLVAGSAGSPFLRVAREYSDDGITWTNYNFVYNNTDPTAGTEYSFSGTITGHQYLRLYFFNSAGTTVTVGESSTYYDVQLEEGSVTTYEPYQEQNYTIDLGNIELCKIGEYQDYIYKSSDDWYVHKETNKKILNGTENWVTSGTLAYTTTITDYATTGNTPISTAFTGHTNVPGSTSVHDDTICFINQSGQTTPRFYIKYPSKFSTGTEIVTWLQSNNTPLYYALAAPTDTKITDSTLIEQLEALWDANTYLDTTHFFVAATGDNLPVILDVEAYRKSLAGILKITQNTESKLSDYITDAELTVILTDYATNSSLATVATSGLYSDLTGTPTIPTVNNATITISNNGTTVDSFTVNTDTDKTIEMSAPVITMQASDPGEGAPLADNNFIAVYDTNN